MYYIMLLWGKKKQNNNKTKPRENSLKRNFPRWWNHAVIAVLLKNKAVTTMLSSELWIAMMLVLTNFSAFQWSSEKGKNGQIDPVNWQWSLPGFYYLCSHCSHKNDADECDNSILQDHKEGNHLEIVAGRTDWHLYWNTEMSQLCLFSFPMLLLSTCFLFWRDSEFGALLV